jgi:PEP-CTERM motif
MGNRRTESNRPQGRRQRAVALLLALFPGFMFVGLLAPAAVRVTPVAETAVRAVPISFENFRYAKRPMLVKDDVGATPNFTQVASADVFFSGARYLAQQAQKALQMPRFLSQEQENQIILDDDQGGVDDYVSEQILEEPKEPPLRVDLTPLWNPKVFDVIPPMLAWWGEAQYDDLVGPPSILIGPSPVPVPEPHTAAMIALGLVVLALRSRR